MNFWTYIKSRNRTSLVAVVAMVMVIILIIWFSTHKIQSSISSDFKCPNDYKTSTEYLDSVALWLRAELDKNPQINTDEMLRLRDRELEKRGCSFSPWIVDDANVETLKLFREIDFIGKVEVWMTYGRILVKNSVSDYPFMYIIAEPDDVIVEGISRHSPTTNAIKNEAIVKIIGEIIDECFWNEEKYGGCVPWVTIKSLQQI